MESLHGKVLRDKYTDSLDSGKDLHAKACNRARTTANWLTIAFWELVSASPAHSSSLEASFFAEAYTWPPLKVSSGSFSAKLDL